MKYIAKAAVIAAGVALVSQAAQAAFVNNDLYVGFDSGGASGDLVLNVGLANNLFNSATVVDLSSAFAPNTFNSVFAGGANGVNMGVVGADTGIATKSVYVSQIRAGGAGVASVAGSDLTSQTHSSTQISGGASTLSGITTLPGTVGSDVIDSGKPFNMVNGAIAGSIATSFYGKTGVQADGTIGLSGVIYEDLWKGTAAGGYSYKGYFTFDASSSSLTFTPATLAAVPEPTTYGICAGAGLLLVALRRQIRAKTT